MSARLKLEDVHCTVDGLVTVARVRLSHRGRSASGTASARTTEGIWRHVVAEAALSAVREIIDGNLDVTIGCRRRSRLRPAPDHRGNHGDGPGAKRSVPLRHRVATRGPRCSRRQGCVARLESVGRTVPGNCCIEFIRRPAAVRAAAPHSLELTPYQRDHPSSPDNGTNPARGVRPAARRPRRLPGQNVSRPAP